mgnify:CR=1 FL=1
MSPTIKCVAKTQSILYISYDGMMEPLGVSQVISYLKLLSNNRKIYLVSFEKEIDIKDTYKKKILMLSIENFMKLLKFMLIKINMQE